MQPTELPPAVVFLSATPPSASAWRRCWSLALFWADPGGIAQVLRRAPGHPWPTLLLWFFCGLTLGAVQIGIAVMLQDGPPDDDDRGGGRRDYVLVPIPVVVEPPPLGSRAASAERSQGGVRRGLSAGAPLAMAR